MLLFFLNLAVSPQTALPPVPTFTSWDQLFKLTAHLHSCPTEIHVHHTCKSHLSRAQLMKSKLLIMSFKVLCHLDSEFYSSVFSFINYHKNLLPFSQILRRYHCFLFWFVRTLAHNGSHFS